MKNIVVVDEEIKLANIDIEKVETILKVKLPAEYKEFLLKHNGGHPIKDTYPLIEIFDFHRYGWGNSTVYNCDIAWFNAIYEGEYNNFLKENKYKIAIPDNLISIGCGSGGDEICIGIKENNFGKVYYWGHDWEVGEEYLSVVLIANNFTDFINSLYKYEIEEDDKGHEIWVHTHDKYSLSFSTQAKKHGSVITNFFAKAPAEVEDYIIEEYKVNNDIVLYYDVKSDGKRYQRIIKPDNKFEDSIIPCK